MSKFLTSLQGWMSLALAAVIAVVAGVAFVVRIDARLSSIENRCAAIETTINELAPRKVKIGQVIEPLQSLPSSQPAVPVVEALAILPTAVVPADLGATGAIK